MVSKDSPSKAVFRRLGALASAGESQTFMTVGNRTATDSVVEKHCMLRSSCFATLVIALLSGSSIFCDVSLGGGCGCERAPAPHVHCHYHRHHGHCRSHAPPAGMLIPSAPMMSAPMQMAPVQMAPVQMAPVQMAPVQMAPVQYAPVQYAPVQYAPAAAPAAAPSTCSGGGSAAPSAAPSHDAMVKLLQALTAPQNNGSAAPAAPQAPADTDLEDRMAELVDKLDRLDRNVTEVLDAHAAAIRRIEARLDE